MRASTRNLIKGTFHKMRGSVRTTMALSGRIERVGGIVRVKFGRTQRLFGW
jgi:hypothetical protein